MTSNDRRLSDLLKHDDIDVNKVCNGSSILSAACVKGEEKIVASLLSHPKINVETRNCNGDTPLHSVATIGMF